MRVCELLVALAHGGAGGRAVLGLDAVAAAAQLVQLWATHSAGGSHAAAPGTGATPVAVATAATTGGGGALGDARSSSQVTAGAFALGMDPLTGWRARMGGLPAATRAAASVVAPPVRPRSPRGAAGSHGVAARSRAVGGSPSGSMRHSRGLARGDMATPEPDAVAAADATPRHGDLGDQTPTPSPPGAPTDEEEAEGQQQQHQQQQRVGPRPDTAGWHAEHSGDDLMRGRVVQGRSFGRRALRGAYAPTPGGRRAAGSDGAATVPEPREHVWGTPLAPDEVPAVVPAALRAIRATPAAPRRRASVLETGGRRAEPGGSATLARLALGRSGGTAGGGIGSPQPADTLIRLSDPVARRVAAQRGVEEPSTST